MNFDEAMKAHSDWKMKLKRYLANPDKSIDANKLGKDNECALGKWIHSEGKVFSNHAEFKELAEAHKCFHAEASTIVKKCDSGQDVSEDLNAFGTSKFAECSTKVVNLLMKMKKTVN